MAAMTAGLIAGGLAAGALGAAAGAQGKKSSSDQTSGYNLNPTVQGGTEDYFYGTSKKVISQDQAFKISQLEEEMKKAKAAGDEDWIGNITSQIEDMRKNPAGTVQDQPGYLQQQFGLLNDYAKAGPGQQDVANAYANNKSLADLFGEYAKSGGMPGQADIDASNGVAKNLFAARQVGLNQSFQDQQVAANRLAAQLGRSVDDPILQAKLRTGFMRQQDSLSAEQQGVSQQLALALPGQRLNYAQGQNQVLNGLSNQAFSNQNFLFGLGNQLGSQERAYRVNTSERYSNGTQQSGGGLGGAIAGGLGGVGAGLSAASAFGGGSGTTTPTQFSGGGSPSLGNFNFGSAGPMPGSFFGGY